jgi:hypothetical protein
MSWEEHLFAVLDDLEHEAESLYAAERDHEVADLSRAEYAQVTLASRLMASTGTEVTLEVVGLGSVNGVLDRLGTGWCLLHSESRDWVVRLPAVVAVHHAAARSVPEVAWSPMTNLGFGSALRRLADAGERCLVQRTDGTRHEVKLQRVGADFVECVDGAHRVVLLAFAGIAAVGSWDSTEGVAR